MSWEDRSCHNNLCFDDLTEYPTETWDDCEWKVQDALLYNLNIEGNIEIDWCHHFGKHRGSCPRMIVCRFLHFKDIQKILQNAKKLKDTGIFMYEDFCSHTMELWKSLWEKVLEYHRQGKYAYLNYRTIVLKDKSWYVFCLYHLAHLCPAICYLLIVKYCCIISFIMNANT